MMAEGSSAEKYGLASDSMRISYQTRSIAQNQQPFIGRQTATLEPSDNLFAFDR